MAVRRLEELERRRRRRRLATRREHAVGDGPSLVGLELQGVGLEQVREVVHELVRCEAQQGRPAHRQLVGRHLAAARGQHRVPERRGRDPLDRMLGRHEQRAVHQMFPAPGV
jgi:hypothetical protein